MKKVEKMTKIISFNICSEKVKYPLDSKIKAVLMGFLQQKKCINDKGEKNGN